MKEIKSILAPSFLPSSAVIETGYACNHECLFCSCPWEYPASGYQRGKELTLAEWKECLAKLAKMGVCSFSYTGGEPLLNKHIFEMIEFADTLQATFIDENLDITYGKPTQYLISNGQLIDDEVLKFIKKYNVHLSMSLPGMKTYKEHTGSGDYRKILNLFTKAKELDIRTTVNIAVTRKNLGELFETISNALIAGAESLLLNRFLPGGRGMENMYDLFLNKDELTEMLTVADDVLTKANRSGAVGTEIPICLVKDLPLKTLKVGTRCSAGVEFFVIGPEGMVRTCNHSPKQLARYDKIEELLKDDYWRMFTQKEYLPKACKHCNLTHLCDGGCREAAHIFTGFVDGNDPIFVELKR